MNGPAVPGGGGGTAYDGGPVSATSRGLSHAVRDRRDALVLAASLWTVALQAVPPVLIAWAGHGPWAGADVALAAVSSPVLLGAVAYGLTLAVALGRPGLEPRADVVQGPVDDRTVPPAAPGRVPQTRSDQAAPVGPAREGTATSTVRDRLRWAALATLLDVGVMAAAVVVDGGVAAGAASFAAAMDDGSAMWTFLLLVVKGAVVDLRAPIAVGLAWLVLARASRPVRRRARVGRAH